MTLLVDLENDPHIWTTNGNVPVRTLKRHDAWEFRHRPDGTVESIKFIEWYTDNTGDTVKRSEHVYLNQQAAVGAVQAELI